MMIYIVIGAVCLTALVVMIPAFCLSSRISREEELHGRHRESRRVGD